MARKDKRNEYDSPFSFGAASAPGQDEAHAESEEQAQVAGTIMAAPGQEEAGPEYGYRRSPFGRKRDEVSVYNEQMRERHALDRRVRVIIYLAVAVVALVPITLVLPTHLFNLGGFDSSLAEMGSTLGGRINSASQMLAGTPAGQIMAVYFWQIIAAALAGAGLALNGAVYQGALKNALASPSTLGVMSGATLGTVLYTLLFMLPSQENQAAFVYASDIIAQIEAMSPWEYFVSGMVRVFCSLAGSLIVVVLVLLIAYMAGRGRISKVGLLISGQVFAAIITSIIEAVRSFIRNHGSEEQLQAVTHMVSGNLDSMVIPYRVLYLAVPVVICLVIVLLLRNRMNLLAFSDDEAKTMGLSVNRTRNALIIVCTVLTAIIVAFVGSVGFVGFLVPHLARMLVGPDSRYLVPASVLLGAAYLMCAFYLSNASGIFQGSVGTVTSIIGIIGFAVLAIKQRREGNVDWL